MRIATYASNGTSRLGLVVDESVIDLTGALGVFAENQQNDLAEDMLSLIRAWDDELLCALRNASTRVEELASVWLDAKKTQFLAPVRHPGKIICLAGNYREHISESGFVVPADSDVITQQLFLKPATALIGDCDEIAIKANNVTVGWETELALVVGKGGRDIPAEKAFDHVFGYTILNDVSERGLNSQLANRKKRELDRFFDWLAGKWFDGFAPCGPWIVTADEISDPHDLKIRLWVNGEIRQEGNTSEMIFRIPDQIAYISSIMTLEPGDIISTGTPVGAGIGGTASLKPGDVLVCEIEKVGVLRNRVVSRKIEIS